MFNENNNYKFSDLIDVNEFKKILNNFFKATGVPNGLIDCDGNVLIQTGWSDACTKFHMENCDSSEHCIISDKDKIKKFIGNHEKCAKCRMGLYDCTKPIIVDGKYVASLYMGQFLLENFNMEVFKNNARKFGYDEESYFKVINDISIVTKDKVNAVMDSIVNMASMLAKNTLSKLKEVSLKNDLVLAQEKKIDLEDILTFSPVGIGWSNADDKIEYINNSFRELFGYTLEDIPDIDTWHKKAYPDENYRNMIVKPWIEETNIDNEKGRTPRDLEVDISCKDGTKRSIVLRVRWIGDKRLVIFNDVTKHKEIEQRNQAHDSMLAMVAKGKSLHEVLNATVKLIEQEDKNSKCSILLLDKEKKHLFNTSSPSLPHFYNNVIDGVEIGEDADSLFQKDRTIVEDISNHKTWQAYKKLTKKANIKAFISEPIISSEDKLLGVFVIYHDEVFSPSNEDIERISFGANLAAIAIERSYAHEKLKRQAYTDYLTGLTNRRKFFELSQIEVLRHKRYGSDLSIVMFDVDHFKQINDTYGHDVGDMVLKNIAKISLETLREVDIMARMGGEEFAILLPQTSKEEAVKMAERLRFEIENSKIILDDSRVIKCNASFGVYGTKHIKLDIEDMLKKADDALYKAKRTGRNKVIS